MKRGEVVQKLDRIRDMSDEEVTLNAESIRKVVSHAYSLLKQQQLMLREQARKITNKRLGGQDDDCIRDQRSIRNRRAGHYRVSGIARARIGGCETILS